MAHSGLGMHHYHVRKRVHLHGEKYPHKHKWKRFLDKAIYVVGIVGPLVAIPQILSIWVEKNAAGVSLTSWGAFLVMAVFWLMYGIMHKEKPIIVTYILWIIVDAIIVVGTFLYG
tara:strand:- start:233 stop:577 length:345 start_codon:yes stop_codon:yes gene_type:complete